MKSDHSPTAERRMEERKIRRQSIMKAAEALFFTKGYDNVTMDGIARETRLSAGALYLYFKSKDELYFAIVMEGARRLNGSLDKAEASREIGYEKVLAIGTAFYQFYREHPEYCEAFLFAGQAWKKTGAEDLADRLGHSLRHNFELLYQSILRGIQDGSVREDVEALKSTILLVQSLQAMIMLPPGMMKMLGQSGTGHEELVMWTLDTLGKTIKNGD